jgi:transposase InsO family protein
MAEESTSRKITLREFKPESYKVWEIATKATLSFNKLFDIVDGTLTDPTPRDDNGTILRPIPGALKDQVEKWQHDHERARDAIIRCLPDAELLKLDDVQDDVTAIWKRLSNEYGRSSNLEYVRASNDLTNLKMDEKTTINDHINKFEQLVHDVNYNKPSNTGNMEESVVNLKFLNTLMVDKTSSDKWETFINAKGPQLETMSTQQLYAEVRVNAGRIKPLEPVPNEVKALKTEFQQSFQSLSTRFDNFQRNNENRSNGKGGRRSNRGNSRNRFRNNGRNNGNGNNSGRKGKNNKSNRRSRYPYDTNKSCELHGRGHNTDECITLKKQAREQSSSGNQQQRNTYGDYQPNFNNRQFTANVTRMAANNTQMARPKADPSAWIIDSAADAFITPFKERLRNYRSFEEEVEVKGFAGKLEMAIGFGSLTLTDHQGNRQTLNDVVYVPDAEDQILSMMKLRELYQAGFAFTSLKEFEIPFPNGVYFPGRSINYILYIWESTTSLVSNAVTTRSASKRKIVEIDDDGEDVQVMISQSGSENFLPKPQPIGEAEKLTNFQLPRENFSPPSSSSPAITSITSPVKPLYCSPSQLWHLRFGHASTTTLHKLRYIKSSHDSTRCVVCIRAKQRRKPFHPSENKVSNKLERIHSDICGPFPTSKGQTKLLLTFLDEATQWCWIATIDDKSSASVDREFRKLVKQIETESDLKIKYLRTDGGGEYEHDFKPIIEELGIRHDPTAPFSPQSNGKAERLNRTLETFARAMLYQANMPKSFWAEAMSTAAYLINRLPSEAINDEIPYEKWHQKQLPISDLRALKPFGCIVHIHVPKERQKASSKVDTQSTTGCFVGYTNTNTMWRVWDFERKVFVNSRDLIFFETEFPKASDFDEPPADPYDRSTPSPPPEPRPIFDEIVVQPPPALRAFKTYGNFQPDNDPPSFTDAMRRPDAKLWWDAFCDEIKAVIARKTWTLVRLPPGRRALPLRWVCKKKYDATNVFEKYKGRIVVKGFAQEAELDFDETFAPVIRIDSVRSLFAICAANDLRIVQVDCKNAFLHSRSDFEIYVQQPEGFVDANHPELVLLLNKALYGLKQASRLWYLFLSEIIVGMGFRALETDPSIYVRGNVIIGVYVDDILACSLSISACNSFISELAKQIEVVNKGEVRSFLGISVTRNYPQHAISIGQPGYIDYLLAKYNMTNAKSASTPFEKGTKLMSATKTDTLCDLKLYQELTGSLNHLSVYTRPDIAFATSKLSKFNANPTKTHFKAALHVLRYLKFTRNFCIVYRRSPTVPITDIIGYSDADFASDEDDRKSYTGYVFLVNGGAITWSTHKQHTVAFSSMESEYMALSDAAREAIARKQFFQELQVPSAIRPIPLLTDSQTALDISDNPTKYRQAKHIDVRYHAVRHYIHDGKIQIDYIPSEHQPADLFTKALETTKHQRFCHMIGLRNSYEAFEQNSM